MIKTGYQTTHSYVEFKKPRAMQFGLLDQEEIQRMSVANLTSERIYDEETFLPKMGAVNDPRMGVMGRDQYCLTCSGDQVDCPGHFGHIELARPVYHVGLIDTVRKILKTTCFNCSKLLLTDQEEREKIGKCQYPKQRFYQVLKSVESQSNKTCDQSEDGCGFKQPKITKRSLTIFVEHYDLMANQIRPDQKQSLQAEDALKILIKMTKEDCAILGIQRPENLIIRRLAVAPPPVRPSVTMGSTMRSEDDLTYSYQAIIKNNNFLKGQIEKGGNQTTINELTQCLQYYVCTLMDNCIAGQPTHKQKSGKPLKAIKERLKGKEGRLRGNLMGKRVDFSARSVITPDPSLALDQLGVPMKVALNMTMPETVTSHNIDEMRSLVANGPTIWPGAKYIQRTDGKLIDLSILQQRSDAHLEYGYKVERHLRNGDHVLFNRQPSLHKCSIMGHKVKVLPFSTFRLNLSVTSPYNADFDGDEMNMFVPQSYETIAEVKEIMAVPKQIVSPQSNKPVMGIVQDSLLGIMLFTKRDNFIQKATVMNLIMQLDGTTSEGILQMLPTPAVLKPKPLWTGKQIMSVIIPNVNMVRMFGGSSKVKISENSKSRTDYSAPRDKMVLIQRGELLAGEFTKAVVGSASGGLNHVIWKEMGPTASRDFLTSAQNVVNCWLVEHGFTVGVQDACATEQTKAAIAETLRKHKRKVDKIINLTHSGSLTCQPGKNMVESFEANVNKALNEARDKAGNLAFKNLQGTNKIQNMVSAGSKGTHINISQIMGCVGQQNVEGKRIRFGFNHRTLPHFSKFDFGPLSKGFVENNYISGLDPAEFFFHAMGGREGLIDTAVKTSETGYIQRRLVKALEDVMVKYDGTVRNSANQIVQFVYGEDGMAGEYIEDLKIDLVKLSDAQLTAKFDMMNGKGGKGNALEEQLRKVIEPELLQNIVSSPQLSLQLKEEFRKVQQDRQDLRFNITKNGDDQIHLPVNIPRLILSCKQIFDLRTAYGHRGGIGNKSDLNPSYVIDQVNKLCESLTIYPGRSQLRTDKYFSEANDNATKLMKIYLRQALSSKKLIVGENFNTPAFDWLLGEIKSRFEQSLVNAGEVVGSIAAHSLGEPATQMTLNTFHFAGVSSKNVTLGVPRLKEIINVAKNIKTPIMTIYLEEEFRKQEKAVMQVQGAIELTTLLDLVDSSQIYYDPDPKSTIVQADKQLVELYNEVQVPSDGDLLQINSPWLLRMELNQQKMLNKQVEIDFIEQKLSENLGEMIQVMHSDANDDKLVLRMRFKDLQDEEDETAVELLKECEDDLLNDLLLKGIPEITKVYAKKYSEHEYDPGTGEYKCSDDNWMLETDGVCLKKISFQEMVDSTRTISNDLLEIKENLGTEASRQALLNELRAVLGFYGIYVNYRHLSCLCDVMAQKGKLTSITRHGINRLDSGPLRKCSFEETCEILLEASVHGEKDKLLGVTENVVMGQLAPIGTGSFDVILNTKMVNDCARTAFNDNNFQEEEGHQTPIMDEENQQMGGGLTPYIENTPFNQATGNTSAYGTPGGGGMSVYEAAFSPGMNLYASPGYASPNAYASSPVYGSPASPVYGRIDSGIKAQSPIYNVYASPIYQGGGMGIGSPGQSPQQLGGIVSGNSSPNYSPTNPSMRQSPYIIGAGQNTANGGAHAQVKQSYSPSYSPSAQAISPASPNYSPIGSNRGGVSGHQGSALHSPSYSPSLSANYSQRSPNYSPTAPAGQQFGANPSIPIKQNYSPSYSPSSPHYSKSPSYKQGTPQNPHASPKYTSEHSPYSPSNIGSAPGHGGHSSILSHGNNTGGGGTAVPTQTAYIPNLPAYNPSSPVYKQEESDEEGKEKQTDKDKDETMKE